MPDGLIHKCADAAIPHLFSKFINKILVNSHGQSRHTHISAPTHRGIHNPHECRYALRDTALSTQVTPLVIDDGHVARQLCVCFGDAVTIVFSTPSTVECASV